MHQFDCKRSNEMRTAHPNTQINEYQQLIRNLKFVDTIRIIIICTLNGNKHSGRPC